MLPTDNGEYVNVLDSFSMDMLGEKEGSGTKFVRCESD